MGFTLENGVFVDVVRDVGVEERRTQDGRFVPVMVHPVCGPVGVTFPQTLVLRAGMGSLVPETVVAILGVVLIALGVQVGRLDAGASVASVEHHQVSRGFGAALVVSQTVGALRLSV